MRLNFLIMLGLLCVALTACPATEEEGVKGSGGQGAK